jgi:hypothetical protein
MPGHFHFLQESRLSFLGRIAQAGDFLKPSLPSVQKRKCDKTGDFRAGLFQSGGLIEDILCQSPANGGRKEQDGWARFNVQDFLKADIVKTEI